MAITLVESAQYRLPCPKGRRACFLLYAILCQACRPFRSLRCRYDGSTQAGCTAAAAFQFCPQVSAGVPVVRASARLRAVDHQQRLPVAPAVHRLRGGRCASAGAHGAGPAQPVAAGRRADPRAAARHVAGAGRHRHPP